MKNDDIKVVLSELVKAVEFLAEETALLVNDGSDEAVYDKKPGSLAHAGGIRAVAVQLRQVFNERLGSPNA